MLEVTGRVVPPAGIPLDAGAVVSNAATMSTVYDAVQGEPFIRKYLIVTGEVAHPTILWVPVGPPLLECVEAVGGTALADCRILCGGPEPPASSVPGVRRCVPDTCSAVPYGPI